MGIGCKEPKICMYVGYIDRQSYGSFVYIGVGLMAVKVTTGSFFTTKKLVAFLVL
jgi:hypothetical protein